MVGILFLVLFWAAREQESIEVAKRKVDWDVARATRGQAPPVQVNTSPKLDGGPPPGGG